MKKINTLSLLIACFLAANLTAQQVTVKSEDMTVQPQETFSVEIKVDDFNDVVAAQFALFWDDNVLEFVDVDDFGLPNVSKPGNFNLMHTEEGRLRFYWEDVLAEGVSVDDMATIFSVKFKAIGPLYSSSTIQISADTTANSTFFPIEFASNNGELDVEVLNGTVLVGGLNASTETETTDFTLFQNSPNPFTEITYINFDLKYATHAQLSIFDNAGKVVFEQNAMFAAGKNSVPVKRDIFQSSGAYYFTLKTEKATATKQLIAH
jgi:hypothetical protein